MTSPRHHQRPSVVTRSLMAVTLAVSASVCAPHIAAAQVRTVNSIRLELRIQPQVGLPADPGGVVDVPGTAHLPITGPGLLRRFEVQYRLLDLDPADLFVPTALAAAQIDISLNGGGNAALTRAVLSRVEAGLDPPPASSPDLSGQQTGASAPPREFRGLHFPFWRSGGPPPNYVPNNDGQENGRFAAGPGGPAQAIRDISPMRFSAAQPTELGIWYGLYSFNFTSGTMLGEPVTLTATLLPDQSGNAFAFLVESDGTPLVSTNGASTPATIPIPAPAAVAMVPLVLAIITGRSHRRARVQNRPR